MCLLDFRLNYSMSQKKNHYGNAYEELSGEKVRQSCKEGIAFSEKVKKAFQAKPGQLQDCLCPVGSRLSNEFYNKKDSHLYF